MLFTNDFLITAYSEEKNIIGYFANTVNALKKIQKSHDLNIISSVILARAFNAVTLLGGNLKNKADYLSVIWDCSGPAGKINVECDYSGNIRGYISNNNLDFIEGSIDENNSLKSEPYIGFGEITVSRKSFENTNPYNSVTVIETGEISQDISVYLDQSLQVQSAINIGVSISKENIFTSSGGLLLMGLPGVKDEDIKKMYDEFSKIQSMHKLLLNSNYDEITKIFSDIGMIILGTKPVNFSCKCSLEKVESTLKNLDQDKLKDLLNESNQYDVKCQYCGSEYHFTKDIEAVKNN